MCSNALASGADLVCALCTAACQQSNALPKSVAYVLTHHHDASLPKFSRLAGLVKSIAGNDNLGSSGTSGSQLYTALTPSALMASMRLRVLSLICGWGIYGGAWEVRRIRSLLVLVNNPWLKPAQSRSKEQR